MSKKIYNTKLRPFYAFVSMILGGLLMVILVISFNKNVDEKEDKEKAKSRIVQVKKQKKQVTQKPKPEPKPKPKKQTPKAPPPNLSNILGGVSMNIPEFASQGITGDSTDLLESIVEDTVMSESSVDSKPKVTSRSAMEYPESAAKDGIKGFVIVNLLISKDGSVELAKIIESQPEGVFDNTVLNGVRGWRFTPARYKGKSVKVWAKQKVSFN
ncbi:energy transducer TonB [Sulfurimonas lithotrophica]|uniref:Energy transducer TonB n=1 Tax=Sulfurimonas lithotrophica TaxID=2590022 RepID=A0A5P8P3H2_9BACT|nr:energy transducer TonB [Sulfurimonas lithotrophica]QFR50147.1 energy transducer TonB [Sulfurimonas lithotrophica]